MDETVWVIRKAKQSSNIVDFAKFSDFLTVYVETILFDTLYINVCVCVLIREKRAKYQQLTLDIFQKVVIPMNKSPVELSHVKDYLILNIWKV